MEEGYEAGGVENTRSEDWIQCNKNVLRDEVFLHAESH